ncbi:glycoside hydrolase family 71 protein [Amniculicola lignicola CBS 123094]|uniref:Glycoside hydrolase family 71 protein n=1 Tax=Amniculicola lignicola CBS 123094 TaxID=1392246 RepID=A0A6A5WS68_9PLEO|nr:glycoside hydrolase family 71 protein [Amniculicola lignicola CBS 123094]
MRCSFASHLLAVAGLLAALGSAAPFSHSVVQRQDGSDRLVFCHFMMGIVPNRKSSSDYDTDMQLAKAAGIDAFALNIGTDPYTNDQLTYAYESAAKNNMKVFISFDFNWFATGDAGKVGSLIQEFGSKPGQLKVDGKVFVSSFTGDGLSIEAVRAASGTEIYFAPNFHPEQTADASSLDGALNWIAWDSDGANKAPKPGQNLTVGEGDAKYATWLGNKGYIAPVSPWFNTHYGPEVSYSKNWVFPGDLLWYNRWNEIINMESAPRFLEIITWNDYGESHYIGPLSSKHTDDGNSKWVNDMPHNGWLDMAKPFIKAYKAGSKDVEVEEDQLVYWYRPTLKTLDCDATDTTMEDAPNPQGNYFKGRPDGVDSMEDAVFVVALLKEEGKVTVTSGTNTKTFDAPKGASAHKIDMGVGAQRFSLTRGGKTVMSESSLRDVMDTCPCGIYNYNAFVGTVPAGPADALGADGLTNLKSGLKVATCEPTASLPIGTGAGSQPTNAPVPAETDASSSPSPKPTSDSSPKLNTTMPVSSAPTPPPPTPALSSLLSATAESAPPSSSIVSTMQSSASPPATSEPQTTTITVPADEETGGECTATVTASKQIRPTNCLSSGQLWRGGGDPPACCDGVKTCCREQ